MPSLSLEDLVRFSDGRHDARQAWVSIRLWLEQNPTAEAELLRDASSQLRHALDLLDQVKIEMPDDESPDN